MHDSMLAALATLNALPRRKPRPGYSVPLAGPLTAADLLDLQQAKDATGKAALADWPAESVFIRVETLVALYRSLTTAGRKHLAHREVVGGWFAEQDADFDDHGQVTNADEVGCDRDAEFCSTPGHEAEVPTVADFAETLDDCSHAGVLFLY